MEISSTQGGVGGSRDHTEGNNRRKSGALPRRSTHLSKIRLSMVHSEGAKDHDFQGMYALMLYFKGKPVSVATLRVFGSFLAEMPVVASRECARRQGHCRALLTAIET
jgi:hypothetical protein